MSNLPPLSAASSAIVEAVKNKAMEISMTGDLEKVIEGYRTCAGLSIRSALQLAGGIDTSIRAEDVIENLKLIADNLDPKMTRKGMMRIEGKNLIKMIRTPEHYSDDTYDSLVDAMNSLLEQLTDEE
jgi:hypothetical protein